jgi:hypothetical protein
MGDESAYWPLMNADERGSQTAKSFCFVSAFIRVYQRLKLFL